MQHRLRRRQSGVQDDQHLKQDIKDLIKIYNYMQKFKTHDETRPKIKIIKETKQEKSLKGIGPKRRTILRELSNNTVEANPNRQWKEASDQNIEWEVVKASNM